MTNTKRIGAIFPAMNPVVEPDFYRVIPKDITVPTVVKEEADTVFLPGTAWRALDAAEELEQRLGKTVITVNQATIWMALRRVGWTEPIHGYGSLLRCLA